MIRVQSYLNFIYLHHLQIVGKTGKQKSGVRAQRVGTFLVSSISLAMFVESHQHRVEVVQSSPPDALRRPLQGTSLITSPRVSNDQHQKLVHSKHQWITPKLHLQLSNLPVITDAHDLFSRSFFSPTVTLLD